MCRQGQDAKTYEHEKSVRYGYSTVAHEPIRSVVRVVMAHRNPIPEMDFAFW